MLFFFFVSEWSNFRDVGKLWFVAAGRILSNWEIMVNYRSNGENFGRSREHFGEMLENCEILGEILWIIGAI